MREVSGNSQELTLVLDEWITEKRSELFRSRLGGRCVQSYTL